MRLYKCPQVAHYLLENEIVDERQIWCYAQMKSKIKIQTDPVKLYGLVLVCVNHDSFCLYNTEFNSTNLEQIYACKLSEMQEINIKKKWLSTVLSFSKGEESFQLEMDDWKRFSRLFEKS